MPGSGLHALYRNTDNLSRLWPSAAIPIGTAILGMTVYGEAGGAVQVTLLTVLIASIVGLKLVSPH